MIFYHFCPAFLVGSILQQGLTLGKCAVYEGNGVRMISECQWLTTEPDRSKQSWATRTLVPYDRTAYRLTINVPDSYRKRLVTARKFYHALPAETWEIVDAWEGNESWYIYRGIIPPKWIVGCRPKAKGGIR